MKNQIVYEEKHTLHPLKHPERFPTRPSDKK